MSPTLLALPAELRLVIFEYLFHSITVRIGFEQTDTRSNHTSILSTCRLIHREAASLLTKNILLHFGNTPAMLDLLSTLPSSLLSQLRRVRVKVGLIPLNNFNKSYYPRHFLYEVLPLLAGLKLDLLVVEDGYHERGTEIEHWPGSEPTYQEIQGLIRIDGWKELHFLSLVPNLLCLENKLPCHPFLQDRDHFIYPWDMDLKRRDGANSGAGVKMYVAREPGVRPEMRVEGALHDIVHGPSNPNKHGAKVSRELILIVKRGSTIDYTQQGYPANLGTQDL
jgi:hypothetical protein